MNSKLEQRERVTLITTERNEVDAIEEFIVSALSQTQKPDEIIIADGGSTDGTLEIIERHIKAGAPLKLVHVPGNRSVGRNAATAAASNSIIACTDVGSRLDPDWLLHITEPFRKKPSAMAVSGYFLPEPRSYFEEVSTTLMIQPKDSIDLKTWLPSSRSVAYRKEAWKQAGGYPEHTNFNEDTPFDLALKAAGFEFEDGLDAVVYWRPRPNLREFYRQYYFYAVGDALDSIGHTRVMRLTLVYALLTAFVVGLLFWQPIASVAIVLVGALRQARRVYGPWKKYRTIMALTLMVVLITTYDISQIIGYWHGYRNKTKLKNSGRLIR